MILPAINCLWFCFDPATKRKLHGMPVDAERKFWALRSKDCLMDGLEIFLMPLRLLEAEPFTPDFCSEFLKLKYKSIHIGDDFDQDFLDQDKIQEAMLKLKHIIETLEANAIILHTHHLKNNRRQRHNLLRSHIEEHIDILIENTGNELIWGTDVQSLEEIFLDCSDFYFCLDLCHINDCKNVSLSGFLQSKILASRVREIHYSYSTKFCETDPYAAKGFPGYGPFHGLFSVVDFEVSDRTREFVAKYPIVLEGVVPPEDIDFDYLKKEQLLLIEK